MIEQANKYDLTQSSLARQNILNNKIALGAIQEEIGIHGVLFEQSYRFIKKQIADFFNVTERTIELCLEKHEKELVKNGYEVLKRKRLIDFKLAACSSNAPEMDFGNKISQLGVFDFRAFLNIAMLLSDSEKARLLRNRILDIVIAVINQRCGGSTKYINQRDEDYVHNMLRGEDYRKEFTDALRDYVDMGNFKYIVYTNKIYVSIFKENASEYRKILQLEKDENVRDTMYSEVLSIISSYETGFSELLKKSYEQKGRKLTSVETDTLFGNFESLQLWQPLREAARTKMASRDHCFRDVLHENLKEYVGAVPPSDFDRFLDKKSMELTKRIEEYQQGLKELNEQCK
jgi:hypothetical protein